MHNLLPVILLVSSSLSIDNSSAYIHFVVYGKPVNSITIESEGLSNSQDNFLTIPTSYKAIFKGIENGKVNTQVLRGACQENITIKQKSYPYGLIYYGVAFEHHHDFYGPFCRIGGKRILWIDGVSVKSFNFKPRKIFGPKHFSISFNEERLASDKSLYITNENYQLAYYSIPDFKITPGERYLVSFKYLLPYTDDCMFTISRFYDTYASWKSLSPLEYPLRGDGKNYYRKFQTIIKTTDYNSILLKFKVTTDDNIFRQCFIRDLTVTRMGDDTENP